MALGSPKSGLSPASLFPALVGVCFLQSLTHSVLLTVAQFLLLPWLLHPEPWPSLKPTAQATGAAVQISQLQFQPSLPHPWLPDPAQSPIPSLLCKLSVKRGRSTEESVVYTLQPPWKDSLISMYHKSDSTTRVSLL